MKVTRAALWLLQQLYKPGVRYMKAGVMLMELVPEGGQQTDLFGYSQGAPQASNLMRTIDSLNQRYGRGTVKLGSEGLHKAWAMRRELKSPNYLGDWAELPKVYAR